MLLSFARFGRLWHILPEILLGGKAEMLMVGGDIDHKSPVNSCQFLNSVISLLFSHIFT